LREFNLSAKQLGLFFLLSSLLYALSSPGWGYLADKMTRTWILMVIGLLLSAVGLLLLGPSPITGLTNSIWLNVVALIILGTFISMALLPTFEAMLDFAIDGGYRDETSTYGLIAGLWSSMYSLGEVMGPSLGAFLTDHFGFPVCASVMAGICVLMAVIVLIYFLTIHDENVDYSTVSSKGESRRLIESDSGISENENGVISSGYPSSSGFPVEPDDPKGRMLDEKTPLLSRSLDGSSFLACQQVPENENRKNSWQANWLPPPLADSDRECRNKAHSFSLSVSYPEVLKTISITAQGAVEV
jgi:MFS family permease